jgi:uncharacterized membrane protein YeaQ/YmgE (transglycosylase-associated protein family)
MGTVGAIIGWIVFGIIAGAIARLLVPGRQAMGILATMALGIVGSFVGGFVASLMFGDRDLLSPSGWIGSILGAIVVLLLFVGLGRRSRTHV